MSGVKSRHITMKHMRRFPPACAVSFGARRYLTSEEWEKNRLVPREFHLKAAEAGIPGLGFPEEYAGILEVVNTFHQLGKIEELAGAAAGGVMSSLLTHSVALPPLIALGSEDIRQRIVPALVAGGEIMAIAVTEPSGSSNVAAIQTRAERRGSASYVTGTHIERLYREARVLAIGSGSEEILLDLAGWQMGFGAGFGIADTGVRASH